MNKSLKNYLLIILVLFGSEVGAQNNFNQDTVLKKIFLSKKLLPDTNFKTLYMADFTSLLLVENKSNIINSASFDLQKPSAKLTYAYMPKNKRWFINSSVKAGSETNVFDLIKNQTPATAYNLNVSFSQVFFVKYFYSGEAKYELFSSIKKKYDLFSNTAKQRKDSIEIESRFKYLNDKLNAIYKKKQNENDKYEEINKNIDSLIAVKKLIDSLYKSNQNKRKILDTIYNSVNYTAKGLAWFSFNQKVGGLKFSVYEPNNMGNGYRNKKTTDHFESSASINYFYKSGGAYGSYWSRLLQNSLVSLGGSLGYYNNFDELNPSEFKENFKLENAAKDSTYTKGNTYTVYDGSEYITYHAGKIWLETYKMFDKKGTIGLRAKIIRDIPYGRVRKAQSDLETGIIFNTIKPDGVTKFTFEIGLNYYDLNGRNVKEDDLGQRFYKRNSINIKAAVPFNLTKFN